MRPTIIGLSIRVFGFREERPYILLTTIRLSIRVLGLWEEGPYIHIYIHTHTIIVEMGPPKP